VFTAERIVGKHETDIARALEASGKWKFRPIEEKLIEFSQVIKPTDPRELRKFYRKQEKISQW